MGQRLVVVLFGPPGAGKTTIARQSGLTVYDRDDPHWRDDAHFRQALSALGRDRQARAVAIRSGATASARAKTLRQVHATHAFLVLANQDECHDRVGHRRRADARISHSAIGQWFTAHDNGQDVARWPGDWGQALTCDPIRIPPPPTRARGQLMPTTRHHAHRGGRLYTREKRRMHELYGYMCHLCGHDGGGEADHLTPLSVWPDQPVSAELWRPAHGANYPCATCGRKCNTERGAKPMDAMSIVKTSQDW